ncbi:MAG: hypothetical protein K0R26_706 [Bacteroidota bacterium]|jgi:hypothetical protein|nr:hypothetical protein [Bacteroidota bacterium]
MTHYDKLELLTLRSILTQLKVDTPSVLSQVLSELDLSLNSESILIYRNLNELFLCINTHHKVDDNDFREIKSNLIRQIDLAIKPARHLTPVHLQ